MRRLVGFPLLLALSCGGAPPAPVSRASHSPGPAKADSSTERDAAAVTCPARIDVADLLARHAKAYGSEAALTSDLPLAFSFSFDQSSKKGSEELILAATQFRETTDVAGLHRAAGIDASGSWEQSEDIGLVVRPRKGREDVGNANHQWLWLRRYLSASPKGAACVLDAGRPMIQLSYDLDEVGSPKLAFDLERAELVAASRISSGRHVINTHFTEWTPADSRGVRWPSRFEATHETSDASTSTLVSTRAPSCAKPSGPGADSCFGPTASTFAVTWPDTPVVRVPFVLFAGEIALQVTHDGEKSWAFLDSGASVSMIDAESSIATKFRPAMEVSGTGSTQAVTFGLGELANLGIGGLSLSHVPVASAPFPALAAFGTKRPDLFVGYSLFVAAAVRIDFVHGNIELAKSVDALKTRAMIAVPVMDLEGKLVAVGSIEGRETELQLDTGNNSGFTLYKAWTDSVHLLDGRKSAQVVVRSGAGAGGTLQSEVRIASGIIGPVHFDDRVSAITDPPGTGSNAGLAGTPLFARCASVIFDHANRTLWVEPPCNRPMRPEGLSGLHMTRQVDAAYRDLPWVVEAVVPESPGSKVGIVAGDRVLSVDGRPASGDIDVMQDAFAKREGASLVIELVRGTEKKRVTLKLVRTL